MDRSDNSRMCPTSSAAASMAALAAAAADSGAANGAVPPHGVEGNSNNSTAEMAAVGDVASSRRVAAVAASPSPSPSTVAARRGAAAVAVAAGGVVPSCQVERCTADMSAEKKYNRRHKVCDAHHKASVVLLAGLRQRFCQQCSRFHELSYFDDTKRSCRLRLAGHNVRRRRNPAAEAQGPNGRGDGDPGNHVQIR